MLNHREPTASPPSRVIVLGASGFVGRNLIERLTTLGVPAIPLASGDVDLCAGESVDVLRSTVRKEDSLVFVSAITPDRGRDVATLMRNLAMGGHVSAWLAAAACAHVVYISSDAVYADEANPVRESSCREPATLHGLMHLARERMLLEATRVAAIPLAILRPSLLYGPGDTHNGYGPNRFVWTAVGTRQIALFGQGEEKRDHVYIDDLSRMVALCLMHRSEGVLNVATGVSHSFLDVALVVQGLCGEVVQLECAPRTSAITHRHFDTASTWKTFPAFRYASLQTGLGQTLELLKATR